MSKIQAGTKLIPYIRASKSLTPKILNYLLRTLLFFLEILVGLSFSCKAEA